MADSTLVSSLRSCCSVTAAGLHSTRRCGFKLPSSQDNSTPTQVLGSSSNYEIRERIQSSQKTQYKFQGHSGHWPKLDKSKPWCASPEVGDSTQLTAAVHMPMLAREDVAMACLSFCSQNAKVLILLLLLFPPMATVSGVEIVQFHCSIMGVNQT